MDMIEKLAETFEDEAPEEEGGVDVVGAVLESINQKLDSIIAALSTGGETEETETEETETEKGE